MHRELLSSDAMREYSRARVYLDENYKCQEHFTGLESPFSFLPLFPGAVPPSGHWVAPDSQRRLFIPGLMSAAFVSVETGGAADVISMRPNSKYQ
ncbi:Type I inositol 1,4,5-trisphosphate 5-phosphatase [Liparis tanakae]|uniref:Type I inositol 1,4,5-trisphosphate 5-phosphatase n=1 Tax=Liparis tanakae TaxID=230148 RepID=A0A4Z2F4T8_9TELE|nr:Type I inositol 1,4,5-trisphosphate 5-phosphatase [Liparis tanakae]